MIVTEKEAVKLRCVDSNINPHKTKYGAPASMFCLGAACMAWKWIESRPIEREGCCGKVYPGVSHPGI